MPQEPPQSQMPSHTYANLCHGSSSGEFFSSESPANFVMLASINLAYILLLGSIVSAMFINKAQTLGLHHCRPSKYTHGRHMCLVMLLHSLRQECIEWLLPLLPGVWGSLLLYKQLFSSPSINMMGLTGLGVWQGSQLIPPPSLHVGGAFPGFVLTDDMVDSKYLVGIKPGHFGIVIGYQIDETTYTWLANHFVAQSHINPGFMGKV